MTDRTAPADFNELRKLFEADPGSAETLSWINDQLKRRNDDDANALQMQVVRALRSLRSGTTPSQDLLGRILAANGLSTPDGRPLHRYIVSDEQYAALRTAVARQLRTRSGTQLSRGPAHFVLFVSEWFRRAFAGGQQRWSDVADALAAPLPYGETPGLTRDGLRWWRRGIRVLWGDEQRLLTLALEGGFPTRLFETERGWLLDHLRRSVAAYGAARGEGLDAAAQAVESVEGRIPVSFRGGDLRTLSAELVCAVANLRREAEALEPRALPLSVRLDAARPLWREDLPVRVEGEGARRLLDELVSAPTHLLAGDARCRRLLLPEGEAWHPALELNLAGELRPTPPALRGREGRFRVWGAGELGRSSAGEIALLDPPGEEGGWLVRPRGPAVRRVAPFPFRLPVQVEIRREGETVTATWPQGEPQTGQVLVFADVNEPDADGALVLVGAGSCRSRKPVLHAWTPPEFEARGLDGAPLAPVYASAENRLFRLEAATLISAPGAEFGYRVELGATQDRVDRLRIEGDTVTGLRDEDDGPVFAGPPVMRGQSNGHLSEVEAELRWRRLGEAGWRTMAERPIGRVELIWRDAASRALRDRVVLSIAPEGCRVVRRARGVGSALFSLQGAEGWMLEPAPSGDLRSETNAEGLKLTFRGTPERAVGLLLHAPLAGALTVRCAFPAVEGGFARRTGEVLGRDVRIMVDDLRELVAFAPSRCLLSFELHGRPSSRQAHAFEEELSLSQIATDVAQVLAAADDLDAWVVMTVDSAQIRVGRYVGELHYDRASRTLALKGVAPEQGPVRFEWRSFLDPTEQGDRLLWERASAGGGPVPLPDDLPGPGLVLVRIAGRASVRPIPFGGAALSAAMVPNALATAGLVVAQATRAAEVRAVEAGQPAPRRPPQPLRWMQAMLAALKDAPPTSMDVFRLLWRQPSAAAALLLSSNDEAERERIWRLEQSTPLMWMLAPLSAWQAALSHRLAHWQGLLTQAALAAPFVQALEQVRAEVEALVALDPLLRAPLAAAGACAAEPRLRNDVEIAQERLRRSTRVLDDRSHGQRWPSCFYDDPKLRPLLPPLFHARERWHGAHWEGLEAPCVAALRVVGRAEPTADQRLRIRAAYAEDPLHFSEAYAVFVADFARETPLAP